jgi:hypothetical protein
MSGKVLKTATSRLIIASEPDDTVWEYTISDETVVERHDGEPIDIATVTAGSCVTVTAVPNAGDDPLAALFVKVLEPGLPEDVQAVLDEQPAGTVEGIIEAVDHEPPVEKAEALLVVSDDFGTDHTTTVMPETDVIVDGEAAGPRDLAEGQHVEVHVADDGMTAETVLVRQPIDYEEPLTGQVTSLDPTAGTVQIRRPSGAVESFTISSRAPVTRHGQPVDLSEVVAGDLVLSTSRYLPQTSVVTRLAVAVGENSAAPQTTTAAPAAITPYVLSGRVAAVESEGVVLDGVRIVTKGEVVTIDETLVGQTVEFIVEADETGQLLIVESGGNTGDPSLDKDNPDKGDNR